MRKPLSHRLFHLVPDASKIVMIFVSLLMVVGCADDDQGYTPLNINTEADMGEVPEEADVQVEEAVPPRPMRMGRIARPATPSPVAE